MVHSLFIGESQVIQIGIFKVIHDVIQKWIVMYSKDCLWGYLMTIRKWNIRLKISHKNHLKFIAKTLVFSIWTCKLCSIKLCSSTWNQVQVNCFSQMFKCWPQFFNEKSSCPCIIHFIIHFNFDSSAFFWFVTLKN